MRDEKQWFLGFLSFTFYVRIIVFIVINLVLFYFLADLFVNGDLKTFLYVLVPIIAIIIFILVISYLNYYDINAIKERRKSATRRISLYLIYEGIALIITAYKAPVLLLVGAFDIALALNFRRDKYKKLFKKK